MANKSFEIMVIIDNTENFPSWPLSQKIERYQRVMEWHEYIAKLSSDGLVTHVWGSHQLLSRFDPTTTLGPLIVIYKVSSWRQFDLLIEADPLRDISRYVTSPLDTLKDDQKTDHERTDNAKDKLLRGKTHRQLSILEDDLAFYNAAPEYLNLYQLRNPDNLKTDLNTKEKEEDALQILVIGSNPESLITDWTDARKYILYEKVNYWFDYMAMMIEQGFVTHAWGTHDFCNASGPAKDSKGAAAIYKVRDLEEFHMVYNLDPIREWARFHTVLLRPIADQREADEARLKRNLPRLK